MINHILVVVENIDPDNSSGAKANIALIQNLMKCGYKLTVLHYTLKQIDLENINCIAIPEQKWTLNYLASRLERQLRYKLKIDLHEIFEKIWGFSFTLFNDRNSIIKAVKGIRFKPDLIITLSQGGSFRPHHAILKLPDLHDKWIAYIHDPYPMHLYPRPYTWVEPGYKKKYLFIKKVCEKAYKLAFPSKFLMEWMDSYFHNCINKGVIIPHQISNENSSVFPNLPDYFDTTNFNILHAGNLLWGRDPKGLIEGYKLFLTKNASAKNDSRLIFLGGKNHYSEYLDLEAKNDLQIYVSKNYVSHSKVLKMQQSASVNIILEARSEISPFLPGKFPHCIKANKPILLLGPYFSESRRLLGDKYPYWATIDQTERIANLIEMLYKDWVENKNPYLNRNDLDNYLSEIYLSKIFNEALLQ